MALVFNQLPPSCSLAQSPVAFSVFENSGLYSASQFQYTCQLTYWTGSASISGSYDYLLTKYPNTVGVGIFDVILMQALITNILVVQYTTQEAMHLP